MFKGKGLIVTILIFVVVNCFQFAPVTVVKAATSYYISSSTGDDNNNGTSQSTPWKTLSKMSNTIFQAGDTICLKAGDKWNESVILKGDGTSTTPITLTSYGTGSRPEIYRDFESKSWCVTVDGCSGWKIMNLELFNAEQGIVGDYRNQGGKDYLWIENCYFHDLHMPSACASDPNGSNEHWGTGVLLRSDLPVEPYPRISNVTVKNCFSTRCDSFLDTWSYSERNDIFTNITIDGCTAIESGWNTVTYARCKGSKIKNSVFLNNGNRPISVGGTDLCTGVNVVSSASDGITIQDSEYGWRKRLGNDPDGCAIDYETKTYYYTLANVYMHDNPAPGLFFCNNDPSDSLYNTVSNNIFKNNAQSYEFAEIYAVGDRGQITTGIVSDNTFYCQPGVSKWAGYTSGLTFIGNVDGTGSFAAAPMANVSEDVYSSNQTVTLSCATSGATIRYTTDGSIPTAASTQYTGPITISSTTCLNAKAFVSGMENSSTMTRIYEIDSGYNSPSAFSDYFVMPEVTNGQWTGYSGTWAVESGKYGQSSTGLGMATVNRKIFSDGTIEFKVKIASDNGDNLNWAGIQFRKTDPSDSFSLSGYLLYLRNNGMLELFKSGTILATYNTGMTPVSSSVPIKVELIGSSIKVYWNGGTTPVINVNDSQYTRGFISLMTLNTYSYFDDVVIKGTYSDDFVSLPGRSTMTSSTVNSSYIGNAAIDDNNSTCWSSVLHSGAAGTEYICMDTGAVYPVDRVRILPRQGVGNNNAFPVDFKLQYSTDAENWTDVPGQSYTSYPNPGSNLQTFQFGTTVSARYIRMYATKLSTDGANYYCQIAELYADTYNAYTALSSTGAIASSQLSSFPAVYAKDDNNTTFWSSVLHSGAVGTEWIYIDTGAVNSVSRVRIMPRQGVGSNNAFPVDFKLQYSTDAINWTDVLGQSYTNYDNPGSNTKIFQFSNAVSARYIRMYATKLSTDGANYYCQIADIYADTYKGAYTVPRNDAVASSVVTSGYEAFNVKDSNNGTVWSSVLHSGAVATEWIYVDTGAVYSINKVRMVPRQGVGNNNAFPVDFKLQYSTDAATWTDVPGQSYTSYPNPGSNLQTFQFNTTVLARYIRMYATKLGVDDGNHYYCQIAELYADTY